MERCTMIVGQEQWQWRAVFVVVLGMLAGGGCAEKNGDGTGGAGGTAMVAPGGSGGGGGAADASVADGTSGTQGAVDADDAGADAPGDSVAEAGLDTPAPDALPATDGGCTPGQACALVGGAKGVCKGPTCGACLEDDADDAVCAASYDGRHVCHGGKCVPNSCLTSAACANGRVCGSAMPNVCGDCDGDDACKNDSSYGADFACVMRRCRQR